MLYMSETRPVAVGPHDGLVEPHLVHRVLCQVTIEAMAGLGLVDPELLVERFRSLRDTLTHLVEVELLWLERWRGTSPLMLLSPHEFPTVIALSACWLAVESEMKVYLAQLDEEALGQPISYLKARTAEAGTTGQEVRSACRG
jgi:uncharacterized damage-inducible protein DinB